MNASLPSLFVSHGSPMLLLDQVEGRDYSQWGKNLPKPKAILVFSAHWEGDSLAFGEIDTHQELIYDFYGFPDELYKIQYPAPGAPWLVEEINTLLGMQIPMKQRGLDHGVYVPFVHMWPEANIPMLQISLPQTMSDKDLFEMGQSLAPLRERGVLIIGAGALTHNLRAWNPKLGDEPVEWAKVFDDWIEKTLNENDIDALLNWKTLAPNAELNHPTAEHFRPLFIAAGAGLGETVTFPTTGFSYGIFTRRSVQFGI